MLKTVLAIGAACAAALALSVGAAPASAKQPCWRTLISDWYDGRIDGVYPVKCYQDALKHAPDDVRIYGDLPRDIAAQMRASIGQRAQASRGGGQDTEPDAGGVAGTQRSGGPPSSGKPGGAVSPSGQGEAGIVPLADRSRSRGPIQSVLDKLGPGEANSIPIPLLVLAGIALLLVAAGSAGMVAKRVQARRARMGPPPGPAA